jgi:hypothetical protein
MPESRYAGPGLGNKSIQTGRRRSKRAILFVINP